MLTRGEKTIRESLLREEEERLLSLGKELDLKRKLSNWTNFRDARQSDYNRLVATGVAGEMLAELDTELKELNDKVISVTEEYEAIVTYNRQKGWS